MIKTDPGLLREFDPAKMRGSFDFGPNATGVVHSRLHFTGDEIISEDVLPGPHVQAVMDRVASARERQNPASKGKLASSIPLPLYYTWLKEWKLTGRLHGQPFSKYVRAMLDGDFTKFRVRT